MNDNKSKIKFLFLLFIFFNSSFAVNSEIIILTGCKKLFDSFIKNIYILNLEKSLMSRNYIYDAKTYKKHRVTDLSIKKENTIERFIYEDGTVILTKRIGYPQFYTQLVFEKDNPIIQIKTVINNQKALTKISTCDKIELFEKES